MAQGATEGGVTHSLALQMSYRLSQKACGKAAELLGKVTLRPGRVGAGQVGKGLTAGQLRSLNSPAPQKARSLHGWKFLSWDFSLITY